MTLVVLRLLVDMNGKQQTKHLLNLLYRPHLWPLTIFSDNTKRKNFSKSLPPPRSDVWKQQWAKPDNGKKSQLAKLWLVQLFAYCDAQSMSKMFESRVTQQWRGNMELIKEMKPYWDDAFLIELPAQLVPKQFLENWLNPPPTSHRWAQIHRAWFSTDMELLDATEELYTVSQVEVSGEYGKTLLDAGAYLCDKASALPGAQDVHKLARLVHLFFHSALNYGRAVGDSPLDVAWIETGGWLNSISDLGQDQSGFSERYELLKGQSLSHRLTLLRLIADGTNLGQNGEIRFSSEAYRWAYQSDDFTSNTTIYDCACSMVPEYTRQWRNVQDIGIPVPSAIDSTRNISVITAPASLPENLFDL